MSFYIFAREKTERISAVQENQPVKRFLIVQYDHRVQFDRGPFCRKVTRQKTKNKKKIARPNRPAYLAAAAAAAADL